MPGGTSDCREPKAFKIFSHQNKHTSQYLWQGEVIRDSPGLKDLALSWWIGSRFIDAGEICELRLHTVTCLASHHVGKQHRTNNESQNRIKWSWIEPRLQRKSTNQLKFTWWNIFLYLFLYFYVFTTILFFHTIVICAVIYAPILCCLWCDLTSPTSGFAMWLAGRLTQKSVAVEVEKSFQNCSALALRILLPLSHSSLSGKTTVWLLHMNWSISIF